jgi:hypothetical protein
MDRRLMWVLAASVVFAATVALFSYGTAGTAVLWNASHGGQWLLPLIGVAALIDSVNPCAFSILLLTVAFLLSVGKLRSSILQIGSAYIAGLFVVYFMIGLGLLQTLHLFNTPHFMATVGAVLLVALGLINVANEFLPAFPIKLAIPHSAHRRMAVLMERASIPTAVVLGALVGVARPGDVLLGRRLSAALQRHLRAAFGPDPARGQQCVAAGEGAGVAAGKTPGDAAWRRHCDGCARPVRLRDVTPWLLSR